jgi:hypothetical protein
MVAHSCNHCICQIEAEGSQVPFQPGLHSETLSQIRQNKTETTITTK